MLSIWTMMAAMALLACLALAEEGAAVAEEVGADTGAAEGAEAPAAGTEAPAEPQTLEERAGAEWEAAKAEQAAEDAKAAGQEEQPPEAKPEVKPEEQPPAEQPQAAPLTPQQLTEYHQQLTTSHQSLQAYRQQLEQFIQDPAFQAGAEAYRRAQTGQAGTTESQDGQSQESQAMPWDSFEPATETEEQLVSMLKDVHGTFLERDEAKEAKIAALEQRLGVQEQDLSSRQTSQSAHVLNTALAEIAKEFPDLVDEGDKQNELELWASRFLDASIDKGDPMTVQEALEAAAHHLGHGSVVERERAKLQKEAKGASAARVDTPGQGAGIAGASLRDQLGAGWDQHGET